MGFRNLQEKLENKNTGSVKISTHCAQLPTNGFETFLEFQSFARKSKGNVSSEKSAFKIGKGKRNKEN